jgi:hypothetical protein
MPEEVIVLVVDDQDPRRERVREAAVGAAAAS